MQELSNGSLLQGGKYRIVRKLGQGGFGITYEGVQTGLERRVAVKEFFMKDFCNRDGATSHVTIGSEGSRGMVDDYRQKFLKEARLIASMEGIPHMIHIYDVFEENATAYYVMEFVGGGSLRQVGKVSEGRALRYISQVGLALTRLHERKVLHLDIKPDNILLNAQDEAVLIDFGVSKHYDDKGSQTSSTPIGLSKGFAPSEQYQQGGVNCFSPATDVYSLAATLYFLLTGQTPPESNLILEDGLPSCPQGVSPTIWAAIERAMIPNRKARTQSVQDFIQQLSVAPAEPIKEAKTVPQSPVTSSETVVASRPPVEKKKPWVPILLMAVLLAMGIGGYLLFANNSSNKPSYYDDDEEEAYEEAYEEEDDNRYAAATPEYQPEFYLADGDYCYEGVWDSYDSRQPCRIVFSKYGKTISDATYTNLKWNVTIPMRGVLEDRTLSLKGDNGTGTLFIKLVLPDDPDETFEAEGFDGAHESTTTVLTLRKTY